MGVNLPNESDADACRRMGWGAGTRIVGDEGYGPEVWEITAVGLNAILTITVKGTRLTSETLSTLMHRDWVEYKGGHR